ncbi:MAG: tetratricopeptide repeat protein [Methanomicrobiaceae archaeon]|nr:tetratricopeptide repeat protein [Methanomicrobiaceae archaeon]
MKVWQILLVIVVIITVIILVPALLSANPGLKAGIGVGLAENFLDSGKDDLALSMCDWVLEDSPDNRDALSIKVKVLTRAGNIEDALVLQRQIVYENPSGASPEDWNSLAVLSMKSGNTSEAVDSYSILEKYYDRNYNANPDETGILYRQGVVLIKLQRYDEAIDCFDRMTKLEPESTDAWIGLGDAYLFKSMYEQGQLVDLYADLGKDPSARVEKYTTTSFESNRKAVEAYNKAVEIDPLIYPLVAAKIMGSYQKTVESYQDILENL